MELLLLVAAVIILDIAAMRWGYDSREACRSAEAWLAAHGYSWSPHAR